ncbi:hypothetical protein [Rugosimonospora africana]|uniref:Uncharacterized protein n=1 Tax=Rugosimonospora africana TaxID=556532 RepID=A0A8J3VWG2_9ACTN|nr:hypothetical protein [Rugosimonospora africana]GIH21280.1 hypothetical protein Raf01_94520 [Rugosimonospora africana]
MPKLLIDLACDLELYLRSMPYPLYRRHLNRILTDLLAHHHDVLPEDVRALARRTIELLGLESVLPVWAEVQDVGRQWEQVRETVRLPRNPHSLCHVLSFVESEIFDHSMVMAQFLAHPLTYQQIGPTPSTHAGPDPAPTVFADPRSPEVRLLQRFVDSAKAALEAEGIPVQSDRYAKLEQAARDAATMTPEEIERLRTSQPGPS